MNIIYKPVNQQQYLHSDLAECHGLSELARKWNVSVKHSHTKYLCTVFPQIEAPSLY